MYAILTLHDKIKEEPLGAHRARVIEEAEKAALAATPTSEMTGLLR
jgi:NADH-quinone oxidoreductase subunit B